MTQQNNRQTQVRRVYTTFNIHSFLKSGIRDKTVSRLTRLQDVKQWNQIPSKGKRDFCSPTRLYSLYNPACLLFYFQLNIFHPFGQLILTITDCSSGRALAQWLRHYATNRQVAGSIPDGVIGIFQSHNPSGRTMFLGSTQPLTEMSTRCISWE